MCSTACGISTLTCGSLAWSADLDRTVGLNVLDEQILLLREVLSRCGADVAGGPVSVPGSPAFRDVVVWFAARDAEGTKS